jgi:hypothetical protein
LEFGDYFHIGAEIDKQIVHPQELFYFKVKKEQINFVLCFILFYNFDVLGTSSRTRR